MLLPRLLLLCFIGFQCFLSNSQVTTIPLTSGNENYCSSTGVNKYLLKLAAVNYSLPATKPLLLSSSSTQLPIACSSSVRMSSVGGWPQKHALTKIQHLFRAVRFVELIMPLSLCPDSCYARAKKEPTNAASRDQQLRTRTLSGEYGVTCRG